MGAVEATVTPAAAKAAYAQFAQRNLDKLSWLYPLVNNKLGSLLHLQLRHEHLFFMEDGRVVDLREEPRCERSRKRDGTVKQRADGGLLSDRDAMAVGVV